MHRECLFRGLPRFVTRGRIIRPQKPGPENAPSMLGVICFARAEINAPTEYGGFSPVFLPTAYGKAANHRHNASAASGLAAFRRHRMRSIRRNTGIIPGECLHSQRDVPVFHWARSPLYFVTLKQLPEPTKISSSSSFGLLGPGRNSLAQSGARSPSVTPHPPSPQHCKKTQD